MNRARGHTRAICRLGSRCPPVLVLLVLLVTLAGCSGDGSHPGAQAASAPLYQLRTGKPFDDVLFELEFAITERNFRITGRNSIGKGLRARGYEFPDVEVIHFCSLEKAREVLLLDPGYVTQMPCRITLHEEGDQTVISAILLPENHADPRVVEFARGMNTTLREIVGFAVSEESR